MDTIPLNENGAVLHLGHRDFAFAHVSMVASINVLIERNGDGPHPSDDKIPNPEIALMTSFRPPGEVDASPHNPG
jgi:hypothetical protein